ncbi:MAG: D-tyrosyl-tRNA(Tyr) deacylase [Clostridia bacterium]|nr:D-tyrosyl-tRNA(Tyr) deacylase [Clostridia bacterium]
MRAVIQRVISSQVTIEHKVEGSIKKGLTVFLGVGQSDSLTDVTWLADKIMNLRIFEDNAGKMNLSVKNIDGELLIISQFTLYGDCKKGNRPNFMSAADPEKAKVLYNLFLQYITDNYTNKIQSGIFAADMEVSIINDGPVTILLDSKVKTGEAE